MRYLLEKAHIEKLRRFAALHPLMAFDYDGTLSALNADRDAAFLRPRTATLLRALNTRFRSAVITGRSLSDIAPRVEGLGVTTLIGNHGIEPSPREPEFERVVNSWLPVLKPAVAAIPGADLENKRLSVSIHYWRSPQPEAARAAITRICELLGDTAVAVPGHFLVNLIPPGAPMKDGALADLMARTGQKHAVFVGDDWNDERVFEHVDHSRVFTVRVGHFERSHAQYFLRSQDEIDAFLEHVIDAVRPGGPDSLDPNRARSSYA